MKSVSRVLLLCSWMAGFEAQAGDPSLIVAQNLPGRLPGTLPGQQTPAAPKPAPSSTPAAGPDIPAACCDITAIDKAKSVVSARERASGRIVEFRVGNSALLQKLQVGQKVWLDKTTQMVSVEGGLNCCRLAPAVSGLGSTASAATSAPAKSKSSKGGLDSIKPGETPTVTGSPERSTAGAIRGRPATSGTTHTLPSSATLAIPRPLKGLQINPDRLAGGNRAQGIVVLAEAPGPNGVTVALQSGNPGLAGVPSSVTITRASASAAAGATYSATFFIDTQPVAENTTVTINARAGAQSLKGNLHIEPPRLKSVSLDIPGICDGNKKATVRYTLTGPAPPGFKVSAAVTITSGGTVYESETVPRGNAMGNLHTKLDECRLANRYDRCTVRAVVQLAQEGVFPSQQQSSKSCAQPS